MKILYYLGSDGTAMWEWQTYHIVEELSHHNIDVMVFNFHKYSSLDEANKECLKLMMSEHFDLFMTCHTEKEFYIDTLVELKKLAIPRLLINFDNKMHPYSCVKVSKYYDLIMHLNVDNSRAYKKYKCPYIVAPYAANPFYFSSKQTESVLETSFVGTPYGTRCHPINVLLHNECLVSVFANENSIKTQHKIGGNLSFKDKIESVCLMMKCRSGRKVLQSALICKIKKQEHLDTESKNLILHPAVDLRKMNEIYSQYALCLSMPEARNTGVLKKPVNICRLRNFEIPMCGGLQITKYDEELANYFEDGKEIVFYKTDDELVEKVRFYTDPKNQELVNQMKLNARIRAEKDHTWFTRFSKAFDCLQIKY